MWMWEMFGGEILTEFSRIASNNLSYIEILSVFSYIVCLFDITNKVKTHYYTFFNSFRWYRQNMYPLQSLATRLQNPCKSLQISLVRKTKTTRYKSSVIVEICFSVTWFYMPPMTKIDALYFIEVLKRMH